MPTNTKSTILFTLAIGVVVLLGVFLGIWAASMFNTTSAGFRPQDLSNQTTIKIGDHAPAITVTSLQGQSRPLGEITSYRPLLVGLVLPGCEPCQNILTQWAADTFATGAAWQPIIVAAGTPEQAEAELPDQLKQKYPVYVCDAKLLDTLYHVSMYPTIVGIDRDRRVAFVISGYVSSIGRSFFDKYL